MNLEILLFGSPQVLRSGQAVKVRRRKSRALLYFLAGHERPVAREQLLNVFWPDLERSRALQTLRTTLYGLRQDLEEVAVTDEDAGLSGDVWVDVRQFEQVISGAAATAEELTAALRLYRGDLLLNFDLPDSREFEDWLLVSREHYRRLAVRGWSHLSALRLEAGDPRAALDALDRALAFDPLQEDLQREAMRLSYLAGDRPGAIRRYDELRRMLDEQMGVPPMAGTRSLYDAIVNGTLDRTPQSAAQPRPRRLAREAPGRAGEHSLLPFTGREEELRMLAEWLPSGKLMLIEGEPGIGKTRLAEEFLRRQGVFVLAGAGRELERGLPYQPLVEALRRLYELPDGHALLESAAADLQPLWVREVARLLPELGTGQTSGGIPLSEADESRLWEGLRRFLQAIARRRKLVLFIDDIHWVDGATIGVFGYLVRQMRSGASQGQLRFLATSRPAEMRSQLGLLLQSLSRDRLLVRLSLSRLGDEEVETISRKLSEKFAFPLAEWLASASEGSPYVLAELVRYARENGILQPDGMVNLDRLPASPVVPETIYTLIQTRLEQLSGAARRILDAGVAVGREFDFEVAARAAGLSDHAALDALEEAENFGFIEPTDEQHYRFNHNLTMEVAYREVGEPRHRLLHRRVADAMEHLYSASRLEAHAGVIAAHFSEGNAAERAVPYALRAAKRAVQLAAWSEAEAFYEQALPGLPDKERFPVWMELGEARYRAGHFAQAAEAFGAAASLAEGSGDAESAERAWLAVAQSLLHQARFDEVLKLVRRVIKSGASEYRMQAEFLWGTALSLEGADLKAAAKHLEAARALCNEDTDPANRARIVFELGSVAAQQGDLEQAVELYRRALDRACEAKGEAALPWCILAHNNLAYHLHLLGHPDAAGYAEQGLQMARQNGMLGQQPYLYSTLGEIALAEGKFDQAEQLFSIGLDLADQLVIAERVAGITANLGRLAAARGETTRAIHRLSTALAKAEALGVRHLAAQIRLWLVPLLPEEEARLELQAVRAYAVSGERKRLIEEVERSETLVFGKS